MYSRILSIFALLILASCAYAVETQLQTITIETPGAENALCFMNVDGLRYKVRPPGKVSVTKSPEDLEIDCLAPGNRRQKVYIKPTLSDYAYGDIALGVLPLAWDMASESLYMYPEVITIDFTSMPVRPEALPAQNRPDVKQPEEYPLEEFLPGRPRRNDEHGAEPIEFQKRVRPEPVSAIAGPSRTASGSVSRSTTQAPAGPYMIEESTVTDSKGDLERVLDSATNPAGAPSAPGGPAYPGQ